MGDYGISDDDYCYSYGDDDDDYDDFDIRDELHAAETESCVPQSTASSSKVDFTFYFHLVLGFSFYVYI